MANRYWVGIVSSSWTDTGNWSASSGGSGGASVPTSSDDVFLDANSGAGGYGCSAGGNRNVNNLSLANSAVQLNGSFSTINVYGNLTLASAANKAVIVTFNFDGNNNTRTLTTNNSPASSVGIRVGDGGGFSPTVNLVGALNINANYTLLVSFGTFNTNNYAVTCGYLTSYNSGVMNLGSSLVTLTLNSAGNVMYITATVNFGTSTVKIQTTAACTIYTGGVAKSFYNLDIATSSAITIGSGSHSFNNISNSVQPATLKFAASDTQTVSNFSLNGTSGNLVTLNTDSGSGTFTLSKSSGLVSVDYLSITNSTATGGAGWFAGTHSTNGGGNTGWIFASPSAGLLTFW